MLELFATNTIAPDGAITLYDSLQQSSHLLYDVLFHPDAMALINVPNTIMLAICTALVLFMVPGLGFFYSGLLRKKNALHIILQCMGSAAIVTVIWITVGFSMAFGPSIKGIIGDPSAYAVFRNILVSHDFRQAVFTVNTTLASGVPFILFFLFQLSFAVITPGLVVGAFADRLKWRGNVIFTILFTFLIYIPVCHWIWGGGILAQYGAIDWAGGIVIHVTCGFAAIASVIVLKRRKILLKEGTAPHNIPLVIIGAAILFFGWFGFNTGGAMFSPWSSQTPLNDIQNLNQHLTKVAMVAGVSSFLNSFIAMAIGMGLWMIFDWIFTKKVSVIGAITGGVAGLATITPAAGYVAIWASIPVALAGGLICYICAKINHHTHFDDALEVWPVHGMGGVTGALIVSLFIVPFANPNIATIPTASWIDSLIINGGHLTVPPSPDHIGSLGSFIIQLVTVGVTMVWTLVIGIIIFLIARFIFVARLNDVEQIQGADHVIHGEAAYGCEFNVENILAGVGHRATHEHKISHEEFDEIFVNVNKALQKQRLATKKH